MNYRFALTFLAAAVVTTGIAIAAANLTNLGKPMNVVSTQAYFPLSGFHRIVEDPRQGNTPELVFIGAIGPTLGAINVERWPVVKALQQFGTLSGLRSVNPDCVTAHGGSASGSNICAGPPTFDFLHARFRSRYLAFHSRDILQYQGEKDRLLQKLTPSDQRLFDRYARFRGQPVCFTTTPHYRTYACNGYIHTVEMTVYAVSGSRQLPLIAIGGYLQTVSQDLNPGDFGRAVTSTPNPSNPNGSQPTGYVEHTYTFNDVQRALITEHDPDPASHLVEDVNAEANIITALICHADGKKPASVCSRPAIRSILKHVK